MGTVSRKQCTKERRTQRPAVPRNPALVQNLAATFPQPARIRPQNPGKYRPCRHPWGKLLHHPGKFPPPRRPHPVQFRPALVRSRLPTVHFPSLPTPSHLPFSQLLPPISSPFFSLFPGFFKQNIFLSHHPVFPLIDILRYLTGRSPRFRRRTVLYNTAIPTSSISRLSAGWTAERSALSRGEGGVFFRVPFSAHVFSPNSFKFYLPGQAELFFGTPSHFRCPWPRLS